MRLTVLSVLVLLVSSVVVGQVAKPLQFSEEIYDFGTIREQAGPVTH